MRHYQDGTISLDPYGRSTSLDGRDVGGNGIGFQVQSAHVIRILTFEVEGCLTDENVAGVRSEWAADELARLGF